MIKQNKIVTDNDDGTFGVQEYCAGCGRDMGVRMYESIEMANRSVDGISKIYCTVCGASCHIGAQMGEPPVKTALVAIGILYIAQELAQSIEGWLNR